MRDAQLANQRSARRRRIIIVASVVLAVVLVSVLAVVLAQQSQRPPAATSTSGAMAVPPNATGGQDGIVVVAGPGKPVVGVYSDYQCAACLQFDRSFGTALNLLAQTGEIELVHHTRVFLDRGDASGLSHKAALAAACADVVGAYGAYDTAIWEAAGGASYTDDLFLQTIPTAIGIVDADLTTFRSCYTNQDLAPFVAQVEDRALQAGYTEAPVLTVNGTRVPNTALVGASGDDLKQIIEDAAKG
jgi:protein-disulfide isomerase